MSKPKPEFILTPDLRFIPKDPAALADYVESLKSQTSASTVDEVSRLGELGVYLRCLDRFAEAEASLLNALDLIRKNSLGLAKEIQQKIRLAHVYQEMKSFNQSDSLFDEILRTCRSKPEAEIYLDFALQHAGKNEFDQTRYSKALELFNEALTIRIQKKAPADQIESTQQAIARTKELLA